MSYLNSVTLIGFVGADPEQRQAKGNGSKFTVLSVATQRSWKNADDEWSSKTEWHRIVLFRPRLADHVDPSIDSEGWAKIGRFHVTYAFNRLGESIADTLHKGDHVLVDGQLVSSKYERENGKSKKAKAAKVTVFWSVRANSVRRLSRAEAEVPTAAPSSEAGAESSEAPF